MISFALRIERSISNFLQDFMPTKLADPANDNLSANALADYVRDCRTLAGADYVPISAKNWWLP